jgi:hypothetical protein
VRQRGKEGDKMEEPNRNRSLDELKTNNHQLLHRSKKLPVFVNKNLFVYLQNGTA